MEPAERSDARANHVRILAAAVALFAEHGIDAEMREIAERAGVGIGTIYRHFPAKDDLVLAVMSDAVQAYEDAFDAASTVDDPVEGLRGFIRESLAIAARYGRLFASDVDQHRPAEHDALELLLRRRAMDSRLASLIERGIQQGQLRADLDPVVAIAMIESAARPSFMAHRRESHSPEEVARAFTEIFLHGAEAQPERGSG